MQYVQEVLDRQTGALVLEPIGEWLTVSELGGKFGASPKRTRAVLHHIGLLTSEGKHGRYRLARFAVERGYGIRHDRPKKSKWPFDAISPLGQRLVAEAWVEATEDLKRELEENPSSMAAKAALARFERDRGRPQTTQEAVCWLRDHTSISQREMSKVLEVSEQLVGRYARIQQQQRKCLRERVARPPTKTEEAQ
jgi:hypothetical protein